MLLAVHLPPPHKDRALLKDRNVALTSLCSRGPAQCLVHLGPQVCRGMVPAWLGTVHVPLAMGTGMLTRQHGVLQGLLGHHVGKTTEDGLQGVAELHQVLGFPDQAVLLTAAGQSSPRGAEGTWGGQSRWRLSCL